MPVVLVYELTMFFNVFVMMSLWNINLPGIKASLGRLQLDYVDIVFANKADSHVPMEGKQAKL